VVCDGGRRVHVLLALLRAVATNGYGAQSLSSWGAKAGDDRVLLEGGYLEGELVGQRGLDRPQRCDAVNSSPQRDTSRHRVAGANQPAVHCCGYIADEANECFGLEDLAVPVDGEAELVDFRRLSLPPSGQPTPRSTLVSQSSCHATP